MTANFSKTTQHYPTTFREDAKGTAFWLIVLVLWTVIL